MFPACMLCVLASMSPIHSITCFMLKLKTCFALIEMCFELQIFLSLVDLSLLWCPQHFLGIYKSWLIWNDFLVFARITSSGNKPTEANQWCIKYTVYCECRESETHNLPLIALFGYIQCQHMSGFVGNSTWRWLTHIYTAYYRSGAQLLLSSCTESSETWQSTS